MNTLEGIIPPLVTPLRDRDTLDLDGLERLVEHVIDGGVSGLFILGTTGEAPSLSYRLRRQLIVRVCAQVRGRVPVFTGITDTSFVESVSLAQHAADAGADALVLALPYYFPAGQTELLEYISHLLPELPLPLMLLVGDTLTVQIVERVSASQKSNSSVDKNGKIDASITALPYIKAGALTRAQAAASSDNAFEGKGSTDTSNDFSGVINVTVTEVLPNGHLMIAGEKQIGVNFNTDVLRFSGQVDPLMIRPGNVIASAQIANVRIEHRGRGQAAEAQGIGWLSRVFLNVVPF